VADMLLEQCEKRARGSTNEALKAPRSLGVIERKRRQGVWFWVGVLARSIQNHALLPSSKGVILTPLVGSEIRRTRGCQISKGGPTPNTVNSHPVLESGVLAHGRQCNSGRHRGCTSQ